MSQVETITGGMRGRLIADSMLLLVWDILDELGWFDSGRHHAPVQLIEVDPGDDPGDPVLPNTVAVFDEDVDDDDAELGSRLTFDTWTFYVDFYAEDDSIGKHLIGDVFDALRGKLPGVGAGRSVLPVYDWRDATPTVQFYCDIDNIIRDRGHDETRGWRRHWYTIRCDVVDTYGTAGDE